MNTGGNIENSDFDKQPEPEDFDIAEASSPKMTASEAIYGFCAWLATQETEIIMSEHHTVGGVWDKIKEFCKANSLPDPRENWTENLIRPDGECSGPANQQG